jgi:chromosomal replication initiator protein
LETASFAGAFRLRPRAGLPIDEANALDAGTPGDNDMPASQETRLDDGGGTFFELWQRAREILRAEYGEQVFKTWIDKIRPVSMDDERVVLACPGPYLRERVCERFGERIANLLALLSKLEREVDFIFERPPELTARAAAAGWPGDAGLPALQLAAGSVPLDRSLTFANFVTGPSNHTAFHVARDVADASAFRANPLLFFGPTGLGKTHLVQATLWRMLERNPNKRVLYLTAEAFMQRFLSSLKERDTHRFKDIVRGVDVLACDDLQFLAGKSATIEEFFHTFDDLVSHGRQIILSADRSPSLVENLPDRLRSRLLNGGGVEITAPDFDLRLAILQAKAKRRAHERVGFAVGDDVLRMMAARIQSDARALDGALTRLASHHLAGTPITLAGAETLLNDFIRKHDKRVTVGEVKQHVARHCRVPVKDLESPSRRRDLVRARQLVMYLSRVMTGRSYPEIGHSLARDHTTIMYGYEKMRDQCANDPHFKVEVDAIQRAIRDWPDGSDDNDKAG